MDTYTYQIGNNLYINLTNRCSNRCTFCVRDQNAKYEGYSLWIKREPSTEEIINQIGDVKQYHEIVFCGYGEPTYRLAEMSEIAEFVRANGGKTRLNTNGHGNLIHKRKIAPQLTKIDLVNISLNAPTAEEYERVCRPSFPNAFPALLEFAHDCKENGVSCRFSIVDCIGAAQVEACRTLAASVGIPLYVREMIDNSEH